jgi:hypothetical protein
LTSSYAAAAPARGAQPDRKGETIPDVGVGRQTLSGSTCVQRMGRARPVSRQGMRHYLQRPAATAVGAIALDSRLTPNTRVILAARRSGAGTGGRVTAAERDRRPPAAPVGRRRARAPGRQQHPGAERASGARYPPPGNRRLHRSVVRDTAV